MAVYALPGGTLTTAAVASGFAMASVNWSVARYFVYPSSYGNVADAGDFPLVGPNGWGVARAGGAAISVSPPAAHGLPNAQTFRGNLSDPTGSLFLDLIRFQGEHRLYAEHAIYEGGNPVPVERRRYKRIVLAAGKPTLGVVGVSTFYVWDAPTGAWSAATQNVRTIFARTGEQGLWGSGLHTVAMGSPFITQVAGAGTSGDDLSGGALGAGGGNLTFLVDSAIAAGVYVGTITADPSTGGGADLAAWSNASSEITVELHLMAPGTGTGDILVGDIGDVLELDDVADEGYLLDGGGGGGVAPPSATGLAAAASCCRKRRTLTWAAASGASGYRVYGSNAALGVTDALLTTTADLSYIHRVGGTGARTTWSYRVVAFNTDGDAPASDPVEVAPYFSAPVAPATAYAGAAKPSTGYTGPTC